ncbi:hypothetical protein GCM10023195_68070 [Actinoallomurus liliacearum]|uniref:Uncharacterized protein n=1 Tax=Actinoallomurus liliacearum TaxID=1080073 RepID=A0ABP8TXL3_9ACTN
MEVPFGKRGFAPAIRALVPDGSDRSSVVALHGSGDHLPRPDDLQNALATGDGADGAAAFPSSAAKAFSTAARS